MKQRDALEIFSFTNYYGAHVTTVLLSAANSVTYAVKTASIVKQHKRVETLLERDSITDLASTEGRLVHLRDLLNHRRILGCLVKKHSNLEIVLTPMIGIAKILSVSAKAVSTAPTLKAT